MYSTLHFFCIKPGEFIWADKLICPWCAPSSYLSGKPSGNSHMEQWTQGQWHDRAALRRANGSLVKWWLQHNPSALNLMSSLIPKVLLEKASLGSSQHMTPLDYANCLGSRKLQFSVPCPATPLPLRLCQSCAQVGLEAQAGLDTHLGSVLPPQSQGFWTTERMLLSAWCWACQPGPGCSRGLR